MKILTVLLMLALPIMSYAIDAYGVIESGAFFTNGKATELSTTATVTQSLKADTASKYRVSMFEGTTYISGDSDIEALTSGLLIEKYTKIGKKIKLVAGIKTGNIVEVNDGKNETSFLGGIRFGIYLKDWIGITIGADHIPGSTARTSVVGGINLTPPL